VKHRDLTLENSLLMKRDLRRFQLQMKENSTLTSCGNERLINMFKLLQKLAQWRKEKPQYLKS